METKSLTDIHAPQAADNAAAHQDREITTGPEKSVFFDVKRNAVGYLDQRALPHERIVRYATTPENIIDAITTLAVRGAPAIGIAGAYGVALVRRTLESGLQEAAITAIRNARPTAINLAWAVDQARTHADPLACAIEIHRAQISSDRAMAGNARQFFKPESRVLTHCHTGAIATAGEGTALGAIISAHKAGLIEHVYVDETRPLLQGARLTLWELEAAGVPATLIVDGAAASYMQRGKIDLVMVGADRIARNRDTANKIGTFSAAVAAAHHDIPFYVVAPDATFDARLASGAEIEIEFRASSEVAGFGAIRTAASNAAENPAFDVTPGDLIRAIITESGRR